MSGGTPFFCTDSEQVMGSSVRGAGRGLPRSTAAALRASLSRSQALKRFAVLLHSFGVRLLCSARQPPPSTADSSRYRGELLCTYFPSCFSALDMKQIPPKFSYMLDARQGSGYVLVECKRPAPKEWSKTAKRFKACDRLRAPQRGAAMEPGHARIAAGHGATISWDIARCPSINNKSPLTLQ